MENGGIFPSREGIQTGLKDPAHGGRIENVHIGIGASDRFLIPELALQNLWAIIPMDHGGVQFYAQHFGDQHFRKGSIRIGYALPLGKKSEMGARIGTGRVWIGEGHGQQGFWKGRLGVRSGSDQGLRWELWITDPHSLLREPPNDELLHPGIVLGAGKKWSGGDTWTVHIRKGPKHPFRFSSRSRIQILDGTGLITGVHGLPLSPFFGCGFHWKGFFLRILSTWRPTLGFTPSCRIVHRLTQ